MTFAGLEPAVSMRAITLWQPWASLIAEEIKHIETRPKRDPWRSAIGSTIAVHAAVKHPTVGIDIAPDGKSGAFTTLRPTEIRRWRGTDLGGYHYDDEEMPLGSVVATCTLVDVVPTDGIEWGKFRHVGDDATWWPIAYDRGAVTVYAAAADQRPFGDFAPGRWAILLNNIVKLPEPIPCRGYQGLWGLPPEVEQAVRAA